MKPVPRLRLLSMQHPIFGGISPIARCIVPQIPQDVGAMHGWVGCYLINGRATQRHEGHLGRLQVLLLSVPFRCYRERQRKGGDREG